MTMSSRNITGGTNIDDFDPDRPGSSATGWLRKVESFARESYLADDQKYSFALGKLAGKAEDWIAGSKVTCWEQFRRSLVLAFPENVNDRPVSRRRRSMERRKRMPQESVSEYITEMVGRGNRLKLPEESIVRCIVVGLDDQVLTGAIPRGMGLQQLLKAIEWQTELERMMEQYGAAKLTVDSFDRLADEMENFVLDGEPLVESLLQGDDEVLRTIADKLNSIVRQNRAAVSCGLFDLGTCKTHQIVVNLTEGTSVIDANTTGERALETHKGSWQTSVISLLVCDVIQKSPSTSSSSESSYVQPAHHLDSAGLLLDLSHLNAICCRESPNFLLPERLLAALAAFRYFTVLDFNGGHLQIPLEPNGPTRSYFTFRTPSGTFQFRRAPGNFTNTTIIFNKILIELAHKLPPGDAVVLNDVLVVPGRDIADGLQKLSRVLPALAAFGLTADLHRSRFFLQTVQLFNWTVRHGKVISNGLPPFEPSPSTRLTLLIKLSQDAATCEASLQRRTEDSVSTRKTIGRLSRATREAKDETVPDRKALLVAHLESAIEHFRQFLLFVSFDVLLDKSIIDGGAADLRRRLLKVQQFDFKLLFTEELD